MALRHLYEEDLDEYLLLRDKDDSELTKKEQKRRDDILLSAMVIRAFGGEMPTKRADDKLTKMILK